jgi:hypothetical protein
VEQFDALCIQAASMFITNPPPLTKPLVMSYAGVYERVTKGESVSLSVGLDASGYERVDDAPPGVAKGLYRCRLHGGLPTFEPVPVLPRLFDPPLIPRLVPSFGQS